ncbi:MAG: peptide chain release factor N(5)-glutamine methyltransferase [Alphaproteobacteria bacterium]|nr:peptide chain release factor N(5)-glutamine methyltransferase [Alphaproteobacteria bacterium]
MPNLSESLTSAIATLKAAKIAMAATDARILVAAVLGIDRVALLTAGERALSGDEVARIHAAIARRARHEPVARILGKREFWGLDFSLNTATLVPRPDSETLIEAAQAVLSDKQASYSILDLGTGSGCLLLALLHEFPHATGLGVDCAPSAVTQASTNATALGLATRAMFKVADWNTAEFMRAVAPPYDLIISNPPYIPSKVIPMLDAEVRDYDPAAALDGGADGLDAYRTLRALLPTLSHATTIALFEIGYDQGATVPALFIDQYQTRLQHDLAGHPRCVIVLPTTTEIS